MMKKKASCILEKFKAADPVNCYLLIAAVIVFLDISFLRYTQALFELFLVIPCMLVIGILQGRGIAPEHRKIFILPGIMAACFLLVRMKHGIESARVYSAGLFAVVYLFAFPLATLLRDGEKKKALKIFAGAYVAATAMLTADALLLILGHVPGILSVEVFWDGTRLWTFWHPNMTACHLFIGAVMCVSFLSEAKSRGTKLALSVLLAMMLTAMALTNSRTTIMATGGYLGATLFFAAIKRGKKWFVPGVVVMLAVTIGFFLGAGRLYQANCRHLEQKAARQNAVQAVTEYAEPEAADIVVAEFEEPEAAVPLTDEPDTANVQLHTSSPQGTLAEDLGSLNGRTAIWRAAFDLIRDTPTVLIWGAERTHRAIEPYTYMRPSHLHNAWIECLVGLGLGGFLVAVAFTVITLWNCAVVLLKHYRDPWKRNVALLALCLLAISVLEPYLFYTTPFYTLYNMMFFLCAGYLVHWQESENRKILAVIRIKLFRKA